MAGQKPAGRRIRAYSKSERVEARFLLLAMVPFFALMASDELGWSRGLLWHGTLWLGVAWAALVIGFGSLGSIRAIRRSKSPKK